MLLAVTRSFYPHPGPLVKLLAIRLGEQTTLAKSLVTPARGRESKNDPARARHRPQCLRRLPCLRDQLQGMEHFRLRRAAVRREPLRLEPDRHVFQPRADLRHRTVSAQRDAAFPEILPALRRPAV